MTYFLYKKIKKGLEILRTAPGKKFLKNQCFYNDVFDHLTYVNDIRLSLSKQLKEFIN